MGYRTVGSNMQEFPCTATWTNATTTPSTITGLSFTPEAGGVYRFEVLISWYANVSTEGFTLTMSPGNVQNGSSDARTRSSSATAASIYLGPIAFPASVAGTNSPAAAGDRSPASCTGFFTAHASAPTAFSVTAAAETGGANSVSVAAGEAVLRVWRML